VPEPLGPIGPQKAVAQETKKTILLIEDEPHIALGLTDALEFEGFAVTTADSGHAGIALAKQVRPDALLLDLMLPDMNGYQVCEEVRRTNPQLPIIMLTARSQEADKIRGLESGADDYVTKPFSVGELVARIRAIFRRLERRPESLVVDIGQAQVNLTAHSVSVGNRTEPLSFYEVELLRLLYERQGHPTSREEILDRVWGVNASPTNRTIDNFIVKLRRKIERHPERPEHILTVYGFGYKLVL
jgi:DNA-binding response OmpR family regulator